MTKTISKLALGLATLSPVLLIVAIVAAVTFRFDPFPMLRGIGVVMLMLVVLGVYSAAMGYFLFAVHRDGRLTDGEKTRWMIMIVYWFPIGSLIYWYRFIWRADTAG